MKCARLVFSFCACLAFSQAFGKAEGDLSVIRQNFNRIYVQSEGEESPLKELLLQNQPGFSVSDRVVMELQQRVPYEAARMRHYLKALQADGCFHQHGPQPQFGNYGLAYVYTMSLLSGLFSDTSMAFTPSQLEVIAGLLEEGYQWVIWQGEMDIASLGRQLFASAPLHKALSLAFAATELGGGRDARCNQVAARLLGGVLQRPHAVSG
ncbi:hypothetical protein [Phocaeicola plebeius]|jgi:hypothetical protein|uniref:hypothetical protein n=1 Tax=Phocaeicola plebeius TaxID=310297 RepID=UPI003AF19999